MIWRIRDRRSFQELRRRGRRARRGTVAVTMLPASTSPTDPPRVAFAVPRSVGSAVVRNRLRRRVRGHLVARRQRTPDGFPSGSWLFSLRAGAAETDPAALLADVDDCIDRLLEEVSA